MFRDVSVCRLVIVVKRSQRPEGSSNRQFALMVFRCVVQSSFPSTLLGSSCLGLLLHIPKRHLPLVEDSCQGHVGTRCVRCHCFWIWLDNKSGAPPGTTSTRSTPLTPAIPTRSMARVLVFQFLIVAKAEGHGLRKLDPLCAQAPSSCEHLFPLFESILSNQEA